MLLVLLLLRRLRLLWRGALLLAAVLVRVLLLLSGVTWLPFLTRPVVVGIIPCPFTIVVANSRARRRWPISMHLEQEVVHGILLVFSAIVVPLFALFTRRLLGRVCLGNCPI